MKTLLPQSIDTIEEAKAFLRKLHLNGEAFHPEDDAHEIVWECSSAPTIKEQKQLNKLMVDIYTLPGNKDKHPLQFAFDPCDFLLWLNVKFHNSSLKEAIENNTLNKVTDYEYCIDKSADPYNEFYTLVIMAGDDIVLEYVYHDKEQAEEDAEALEHWLNITEA